ncbi:MAG: hypothetical protein ABGW69_03715, partial [Nanoarchaeota archaeon]
MNKKNKNNKKIIVFSFLISLFFSFSVTLVFYLMYKDKLKKEGDQQHFNVSQLNNYFIKKYFYNFSLNKPINGITKEDVKNDFQFCENLSSKKDKALCKAYLKLKMLKYEGFKQYLPLALVYYEKLNPFCFINNGFDRVKMAEFLKNTSICQGNEECIKKVEDFIKNYKNYDTILYNIK